MDRVDAIIAASGARGLNPWLGIKDLLAAVVVDAMRSEDGSAVLHGGAAVHFAFGSPRLSVDVDYAGLGSVEEVAAAGPAMLAAGRTFAASIPVYAAEGESTEYPD